MLRLLLLVLPTLFLLPATAAAADCNLINSGSAVPAGYGAAYNVFSSAKELLVSVSCNESQATVTAGSGAENQYIYRLGYTYRGGAWQQITLQSTSELLGGAWYVGRASARLPQTAAEFENNNFVAAYVCQWTGSAWRCGCRDQACTRGLWQLQGFRTESGAQSGGPALPAAKRTVYVSTTGELSAALKDARPGDHIVLADGTYNGFSISRNGTQSEPIVIRAKSPLNAEINGDVRLTGDYVWLAGVKFERNDPQLLIEGAGDRITRSIFRIDDDAIEVASGAEGATIDHNEFDWSHSSGDADKPIRVRISSGSAGVAHHIYRNYFHDMQSGKNNNVMEIGTNGNYRHIQAGTVVEHNLISDWTTGRCISTKSGGNTIRFNTCLNIDNEDLINRAGSKNKWIANWIEGASGDVMRVMDEDLEVIGNRIVGGGYIRIHAGNCTPPQTGLSGCDSPAYTAATNMFLAGNVGDLHVGDGYSGYDRVPARNTRIEAHTGKIEYENHRNTEVLRAATRDIPQAFKLTPVDVGPLAPTAPAW